MLKKKPVSDELPSDELLLAAIDRAEHRRHKEPGVLLATIKQHLGLSPTTRGPHAFYAHVSRLWRATGVVEQSRRHGLNLWGLADRGRELVTPSDRLARSGRYWSRRNTRSGALAAKPASGSRASGRTCANGSNAAISLLDAGDETNSDAWLAIGERLHFSCKRLASATTAYTSGPSRGTEQRTSTSASTADDETPISGIAREPRRARSHARPTSKVSQRRVGHPRPSP